ncbi:MAG TPA: glycosyltransferase family 4 protein [Clostridia bacterium]|nr:glycosyltransferase family 4 protein [Clostridia bacterium]
MKPSVLMVIERFFPLSGGAETQSYQLSSGLLRNGLTVDIVTKKWRNDISEKETFKEGFRVFRIGPAGLGKVGEYLVGLRLAAFLFINFKHWNTYYINGGLVNIFGSTAILVGKVLGKKVISKVETPGELFFTGPAALSPKRFVHPLIKLRLLVVKLSSLFIAQTPQVKKELLDFGIGQLKIKSFTNSVDTSFFRPVKSLTEKKQIREKYGLPIERVIVSFCGRLVERKGLTFLLKAWSKIETKKAILVLIGSGRDQSDSVEDKLRSMVKENKIRNVRFLGAQTRERVADMLKVSDIFVYPSIHPEGTALSVLEAMSCGVPVVVSNIGGLNDVVTNGKNGLTVPAGNSDKLGETLLELIANSQKYREIGQAGRRTVIGRYSTEKLVKEYQKLLTWGME